MRSIHEQRADVVFILSAIYVAPSMSEPVRMLLAIALTLRGCYHWWKQSQAERES